MEKGFFVQVFTKLLFFEMAFVVAIFLALTVLRYFNTILFNEAKEVYVEYMNTEITLGMVLD